MSGRVKKLFRQQTGNIWIQLLRYAISGFTATIVDFALLATLTEVFGEHLLLVWTAIAFVSGLLVSYLLSINWVFDSRRLSSRTAEVSVYILIGVVGLLLTEILMWLLANKIGIHYLISKVIASTIVFLWNFCAKKFILFHK
ncbi:MAG: GtrA family protein [Bacteroidales bacterium]|nr:GtrA family protein [Bacteroidales bacterium]